MRNRTLIDNPDILNTLKNMFYSKTLLPNDNGCMEWNSLLSGNGYGIISIKRKNSSAHRYSYKLHFGEIPKGILVLHKCDNPKCVAPDHLFLGTQKDNMKDMANKNRAFMKKGESNPNFKLKDIEIEEIKKMLLQGVMQEILSKKFNISQTIISRIASGVRTNAVNDYERNILKSIYSRRRRENCIKKRKLSEDQVVEIKNLISKKITCTEISKKYLVHRSVINNIKLNKSYQGD